MLRIHRHQRGHRGAGCETDQPKRTASLGVTLLYLREQMYSASFSAFPQFSPSGSRPILLTGKQHKYISLHGNSSLSVPVCVCVLCKPKGTCLTNDMDNVSPGTPSGSWAPAPHPWTCSFGALSVSASPLLPQLMCRKGRHQPDGAVFSIIGDEESTLPALREESRKALISQAGGSGCLGCAT